MTFQIICKCLCEFTLNKYILKTDAPIKCPCCNSELPQNSSDELRNCLRSYENAQKALRTVSSYELNIHI